MANDKSIAVSPARQAMDKALARLRDGNHGDPHEVAPCDGRDVFELRCVCAVRDKPYLLRFMRQGNGKFRFKESVKLGESSNGGAHAAQPAAPPANTLNLAEFEELVTPCAWCGNGGINYCGPYCGAYVCGGRMEGGVFHCRASCGASWTGVPLREVAGTTQAQPRRWAAAPPPVRCAAPPKESGTRLLLGGKPPAKKLGA